MAFTSDRRALLVVQIEHHVLNTVFRPFLGNDLATVQNVFMRDAVNRFACTYAVGVVGVGRESLYAESKIFLRTPTANERLGRCGLLLLLFFSNWQYYYFV